MPIRHRQRFVQETANMLENTASKHTQLLMPHSVKLKEVKMLVFLLNCRGGLKN